ncbi:MAG TPA: hypothetical protein V6D06_10140 [Trichocoleus sp.]
MKYLIAVLPNREQAESAAAALRSTNLESDRISIIGDGYDSADALGVVEAPNQARIRSRQVSYFVMSFGAIAGLILGWLNGAEVIPNAAAPINYTLLLLIGAGAGAIISVLVGGPLGWTSSGDALSLRNSLQSGKYIVAAQGEPKQIKSATSSLRQFQPEKVQMFEVPATTPQEWTNRPTAFQ